MSIAVQFNKQNGSFIAEGEEGQRLEIASALSEGTACAGFRPMQLILVGLTACVGTNVVAILKKMRRELFDYHIKISATRAPDPPRAFTSITIEHFVHGPNISSPAVERAVKLTEEKYCSAFAMFKKVTAVSTTIHVTQREG